MFPDSRSRGSSRFRSIGLLLAGCVVGMLFGCAESPVSRAVKDLSHPSEVTRRQAAQRLFDIKPDRPEVAAALSTGVHDQDVEVRRWCARALGELPVQGLAATKTLEDTLSDKVTAVRRAAAFSLQKLAPDSMAYREELIAAMKAGDGGVIVALPKLQPPPTWAIPTLLELLKDRRPGTRRIAVESLAAIGRDSAEARRAVATAAESDADDRVRESARLSLATGR